MTYNQEQRRTKRIDCFSRSMHDVGIEHSLVVNISESGAGLLLSKKVDSITSGDVHLTIFHPDRSLEEGLSIDAEIVWFDDKYSSDHHKIGVKFTEKSKSQADYVGIMSDWLSHEGNYFFHCELQKLQGSSD